MGQIEMTPPKEMAKKAILAQAKLFALAFVLLLPFETLRYVLLGWASVIASTACLFFVALYNNQYNPGSILLGEASKYLVFSGLIILSLHYYPLHWGQIISGVIVGKVCYFGAYLIMEETHAC